MDLFQQFAAAPCATSTSSFAAISLSKQRKDFLAKREDGAPVFLLHDGSAAQYSPGVQYKHLTAQFHVSCNVHTDGADVQDQFALVACDGSVPDLYEIFIRCFGAAIEELPLVCGTRELNLCIQKLLDLFRVLAQPTGREVSGLWSELFVIANSGDIPRALAVWHDDPIDRFDFSWAQACVEVKSTTLPTRIHEFALEQLATPEYGVGYVVSLLLQYLSGGIGVLDLANSIDAEVQGSAQLKQKLWMNVAKALGSDFSDKLDRRFDPSYASRNLVVYAMEDVPRPVVPSDPRVTSIRFSADLTTAASSLKKSSTALHKIFQLSQ